MLLMLLQSEGSRIWCISDQFLAYPVAIGIPTALAILLTLVWGAKLVLS